MNHTIPTCSPSRGHLGLTLEARRLEIEELLGRLCGNNSVCKFVSALISLVPETGKRHTYANNLVETIDSYGVILIKSFGWFAMTDVSRRGSRIVWDGQRADRFGGWHV